MKLHQWTILFFLLCLSGCEETIDSESGINNDLIVVEGIITNERINHRIKITRPYNIQNGEPTPVTGAVVRISDGDDTATLREVPPGSGNYFTPLARAVFGKTYTLTILYEGKTFIASDNSVPVEPLSDIALQEHNRGYSLLSNSSGDIANFVDHTLNWENTPSCTTSCEGKVVFYDLKTIDVNELYKPKDELFIFPENTVIIRKKYSVSPAFKAYLRAMMSETRWRGGVFDVERDNVPTNLSQGATGFFAVSTVVSDTVIAKD